MNEVNSALKPYPSPYNQKQVKIQTTMSMILKSNICVCDLPENPSLSNRRILLQVEHTTCNEINALLTNTYMNYLSYL